MSVYPDPIELPGRSGDLPHDAAGTEEWISTEPQLHDLERELRGGVADE